MNNISFVISCFGEKINKIINGDGKVIQYKLVEDIQDQNYF
jgi:hypothetical protein